MCSSDLKITRIWRWLRAGGSAGSTMVGSEVLIGALSFGMGGIGRVRPGRNVEATGAVRRAVGTG